MLGAVAWVISLSYYGLNPQSPAAQTAHVIAWDQSKVYLLMRSIEIEKTTGSKMTQQGINCHLLSRVLQS